MEREERGNGTRGLKEEERGREGRERQTQVRVTRVACIYDDAAFACVCVRGWANLTLRSLHKIFVENTSRETTKYKLRNLHYIYLFISDKYKNVF